MRSGEGLPGWYDGGEHLELDLLAMFASHNAEEVWRLPVDVAQHQELFDRMGVRTDWLQRDVMAVATTLLTALAAVALEVSRRHRGPGGDVLAVAVAAALGGNAVTHVARAVADRAYNGGLATSPAMLLAACRLARESVGSGRLSGGQAVATTLAANVVVPPLIVGSLAAARALVPRRSPSGPTPDPRDGPGPR